MVEDPGDAARDRHRVPRGSCADAQPVAVEPLASSHLVWVALAFYAALAGAAVLWRIGWSRQSLFFASQEAAQRGVHWAGDLGAGLLAAGLVIGISWGLTRRTRAGTALARALAGAIGPVSVPKCLLLALASGVAEEAFFRGALQPRVGLLAASLLFGLAHFVPRRQFLPWTAFSVAAGLLLGGLFEQTGNLLAPVAAHVGINAVNLPLLVRHYGDSGAR